jgi:serine/threonine-protein kinase
MLRSALVDRGFEQRVVGATVAGKYRVRRVMGRGSMGVVCEAEHLAIGKRLAVKLIDTSLAGMLDIAMRFQQEARAASVVESQHIVHVFDAGTDDVLGLYLVMEYLTGEDLAAVLAREGRLAPDVAVRIALQVARGLSKAHEAGVVHRDLKPANIFLVEREDDEPLVKILDFGISKMTGDSGPHSPLALTRAGTAVGTPQYMSPEQAQGYSVDERTDVWSLGLVLYEMLAGRPAYPELPTYEAFIIRMVSRPPDALADVAPWVPEALAEIVHQAIQHDLAARIPSCAHLAQRLALAYPHPGSRSARLAVEDVADTWSDDSVLSPYADGATPREALAAAAREPSDAIPDAVELTPRASRAPDADDLAEDPLQFFDRRAFDKLRQAPLRAPSKTAAVSYDPNPVAAPRDEAGRERAVARDGAAREQSAGDHGAPRHGALDPAIHPRAPARRSPTRLPLSWLALAFITLGLAVVAVLALR